MPNSVKNPVGNKAQGRDILYKNIGLYLLFWGGKNKSEKTVLTSLQGKLTVTY